MPIILTILYALALVVVFEAVRIARHLMISRRLTNAIKKFERHNPGASVRILFIGDSTGYGTGASHERYSIVGRISADFPNAHIENCSETKLALSQARQILRAKASGKKSEKFDVVIIMLGGINLVYLTPLWLVRRTLRDAVALSKECGRETIIISPNNPRHAPLYRFPLSYLYEIRAEQFAVLYREIAREKRIRHVSLFQKRSESLCTRSLFASDKTHPNDEGYGIWYNQMKETIKAVLKQYDRNSTG